MSNKDLTQKYLKKLYSEGTKGYDIAITLIIMATDGKISEKDIPDMLEYIIEDRAEILSAVLAASKLMDDEMIEDMLKEVNI